jgi:hypothetical protein
MLRDVVTLVRLMIGQPLVTFAGNIDRAGVHYRVAAKQHID